MSVLQELVAEARRRARQLPRDEPAGKPIGPRFDEVLRGKDRLEVIAEFKQASPSLGSIVTRDVAAQVRRYVRAGASAVSVLTEPSRFQGCYGHLEEAARAVEVPVLMKDFVVDPAQVQMAARLGARAVLLIVRCLTVSELGELVSACRHYGLTPFIECHHADELGIALRFTDAVLGLNNRDLDTLEIDRCLASRLLRSVPEDRVVVAESGYETPTETEELRGLADAVLVGSALMKAESPEAFIREVAC